MKKGQNKKNRKAAPHPEIKRLIKKTPGGRHAIYEVKLKGETFQVRKPLQ
jgi:hypothetical protein